MAGLHVSVHQEENGDLDTADKSESVLQGWADKADKADNSKTDNCKADNYKDENAKGDHSNGQRSRRGSKINRVASIGDNPAFEPESVAPPFETEHDFSGTSEVKLQNFSLQKMFNM